MSDCGKPSCSYSHRDVSCDRKPSHVKRLNFNRRSIVALDIVEQCSSSTLDPRTLVTKNVVRIPCTKKEEYVRKWIETHQHPGDCNLNSHILQSSPILGVSVTKASECSPILGNIQIREKACINRHIAGKTKERNEVDSHRSTEHSVSCTYTHSESNYESEEKDEKEWNHSGKVQSTSSNIKELSVDLSPVLGAYPRRYKRRRRKLYFESEDSIAKKHLKMDDNKSINTCISLITKFDNRFNTVKNISTECEKLREGLDTTVNTVSTKVNGISKKFHMFTEIFSPLIETKLNYEDSLSNCRDKNNSKIEIDMSNDSKDNNCDKLSSVNSSDNNNLSNFIEGNDTQDLSSTGQLPLSVPSQSFLSILSKQSFKPSQLNIDSDETYYSEIEKMQNQSMHLSGNISQVPSSNKEITGGRSTQTDALISCITSPTKMSPDKTINVCLLDSGKKRRKPKKGTLLAKLHSLVNTQISNIRIWRHQMAKSHDISSTRFISVLIRDCSNRFGNQFLEGILIEDRFNLLQNNITIKETELHNTQIQPKKTLHKNVTIILNRNIVGTLKLNSEVVVNVYPPWDVLDKINFTLEATYISIARDREIPEIMNKNVQHKCEKRVVKEFNCFCTEEGRALLFCAKKSNIDKPNVMQQIFHF